MARSAAQPNEELAHWLNRSGLPRAQIARLVTQRAAAHGHRHINPDSSRVRRWLGGETPRPPVPWLLADVLSSRLGIPLTPADLGLPDPDRPTVGRAVDLPWHPTATLDALAHITRSDLMLSHTRHSPDAAQVDHGEDLVRPLQRWPYTKPSPLTPRPEGPAGRVGMAEVTRIREVTAVFRDADNRLGGALSQKAVVAQMQDVTAMLASCSYSETVGRALFSAAADLGSVAGWMSFDAGMHGSAQRLWVTSLHAAAEGGDRAIGAHILQCMARQMSHLGHVHDALELVDLAQYGARRHASPATVSMLAALQARFHALGGALEDSERATGAAEEAFDRVRPAEEAAHMAYFDRAELCATLGVAHQIAAKRARGNHRALRAEKSLAMLDTALSLRPEHRVRSAAFDHLGMARAHLAVGELAGACHEADLALGIFGTISSRRVADRFAELHDETEPFAASPEIAELRQRVRDAVPNGR
ncbi:transcriptional regulator [Streptomyces sp. TRM70308]|uniref:transcriptional regulator n=1 Tax=Streptomyces sp. TRM70308 TaxID=3131932 RepID=UPI003D06E718